MNKGDNKMIRAVFFDIDGTLTNNKGKILPSTHLAIKQAQAAGVYCGIATGRGPAYISDTITNLALDMYVTYNGQLVYTPQKDIYRQPFKSAVLQALLHYAEINKRQLLLCARDHMEGSHVMNMGNHRWARHLFRRLDRLQPVHQLSHLLQKFSTYRTHSYATLPIMTEPIYQCVMLSSPEEEASLQHKFPDCHFTRSNPYMVDIIPAGGSKIVGIEKMISSLGISLAEVMAFGDSWNDREMLTGVGVGIAMGNAQPAIQQLATAVTASNNADGIYQAMQRYHVIEGGM